MNVVIKVAAEDDAKAWGLLMRHSPGIALPNRKFVVSKDAARALQKAGIRFRVISMGIENAPKVARRAEYRYV